MATLMDVPDDCLCEVVYYLDKFNDVKNFSCARLTFVSVVKRCCHELFLKKLETNVERFYYESNQVDVDLDWDYEHQYLGMYDKDIRFRRVMSECDIEWIHYVSRDYERDGKTIGAEDRHQIGREVYIFRCGKELFYERHEIRWHNQLCTLDVHRFIVEKDPMVFIGKVRGHFFIGSETPPTDQINLK